MRRDDATQQFAAGKSFKQLTMSAHWKATAAMTCHCSLQRWSQRSRLSFPLSFGSQPGRPIHDDIAVTEITQGSAAAASYYYDSERVDAILSTARYPLTKCRLCVMAEAMAEVSERRSLETLTRQLSDTVKGYDDPSGNTGLYTRKKIINIAKEIIEKVKEPQETPFEYSVKV